MKHKVFNKINNVGYSSIPILSPYNKILKSRLKNVKFSFRKTKEYSKKIYPKPNTWLDIGTANGELIYYLAKGMEKTNFIGLDITSEFIKVAKKMNKNLKNTKFYCLDVLKAKNLQNKYKSDVVTSIGTLPIFPNPSKFINRLLDLVNKKGIMIVDGRINDYDVSAEIRYKDDSKKISKNFWRCDFNLHSEKWLREILSKRPDIDKIYFKYPTMDTKIPRVKSAPHINVWTIPKKNKGYDITNGLKIFNNQGFLIVKKK